MMRSTLLPAAAFLAAACGTAWSQFNSAIQGVVTDASQAVVPDATVRVVNVTTGVVRQASTASDGLYRVLSLAPGEYRVTVEKVGFQTAEETSVSLAINQTARVDFALKLGAVSEKVTVAATAPVVETEQGRVSGEIDSRQLREMPLNTRNLLNLLALEPGMTGRGLSAGYGTGSPGDSFAGETAPSIYASGQRYEGNNFTLDDTSVNSEARPGVTNIVPNPDAVEEVRVVSNNFSAVDGRDTGAQIQMISKSGTNGFHGTAHYYNQNNRLAAHNEFEARTPVFRRNLFGGTFGGPVIRNRTFFFASYEGLRQSGGRSQTVVVETPQLRDYVLQTRPNSIAAKFFSQFRPIVYPTANIRDLGSPATGPNTIGPPDGIPDVGSATFIPRYLRNANQFTSRIDHELRPGKDRLYGNILRSWNYTINGTIRPAFDLPLTELTEFVNVNHTHVFSPTKLNELRAGVSRLLGTPDTPQDLGIPQIVISGLSMRQLGNWPRGWSQTSYDFKDVFSWIKSAHAIRLGGELRREYGAARNTPNYIPEYDFANILTFVTDSPLQMIRMVDPRTGLPGTVYSQLRFTEWALFINDDWKVKRNLTVNIGLRYENYGTMHDKEDTLRNLVFGAGDSFGTRQASGKVDFVNQFYPADNKNFGPRVGMAWDVSGNAKTVVRAGYGISYDRIPTLPAETYRTNPPLRATATLGYLLGTPSFTYSLGDPSLPYYGYPVDPSLQVGLNAQNGLKGARVSLQAVDPNLVSPMVHNWFFGIQKDLGHGIVLDANYIGTAGHHLLNAVNVNRFAGDLLSGQFHGFNPAFSSISLVQSTSNSFYQGGTLQVKRQFRQGFTLQGAYTFSKAIDDTDVGVSTTAWQDASNRRAERAVAGFDIPQRLSLVGIWELPVFRNSRLSGKLLGGWHLSGFAIMEKGDPLTVVSTASYPAGDFNADGTNNDRPNAPAAGVPTSGFSRSSYLTGLFPASAFPKPASGTDGNLGRNTYRGPGFAQTDLSLAKNFKATERIGIRVQADAFNAFNRVNLADPVMDLASINFGKSVSTNTPRLIQLGVRIQF
jgi:hypothetical protein